MCIFTQVNEYNCPSCFKQLQSAKTAEQPHARAVMAIALSLEQPLKPVLFVNLYVK